MKIIHTGDIHLDSAFTAMNPVEAQKRRNALRSALSSLFLYAKTEGTQLFIIAGDLFDDECVTKDTVMMLCKEITALSECTFVVTPGNHDPFTEMSPYNLVKWPENLHIFKNSELEYVEFPDINTRVYSSAYFGQSKEKLSLESFHAVNDGMINILVHHGDVDVASSSYCPITSEWIKESGFDYVALGHIHKGGEILKAGDTSYAYCGCLEGRDFGETGYKGAIVGEIEKGKISLRHVRFCSKRYERVEFDVTGAKDLNECAPVIAEKCALFGDDTLLRIELTGVTGVSFSADEALLRKLVSRPSYLEVKDKTLALEGMDSLNEDKSLAGEFYRALKDKLVSEDEAERQVASMALKYGLRAIYGMEVK